MKLYILADNDEIYYEHLATLPHFFSKEDMLAYFKQEVLKDCESDYQGQTGEYHMYEYNSQLNGYVEFPDGSTSYGLNYYYREFDI